MRDLLPEGLIEAIRDRLVAGVADAEAGFFLSAADEDALTGALGQSISMPRPMFFQTDGALYRWQVLYKKIRGRGRGAPEKRFGTDGIFEIEVLDALGNPMRRKGLPFQAKKQWSRADRQLVAQAEDMLSTVGQAIIIDYAKAGYTSCTAEDVVAANGRKREAQNKGFLKPLGQLLGNDFLNCDIGVEGLYYDLDLEQFTLSPDVTLPSNIIATSVQQISSPDRSS